MLRVQQGVVPVLVAVDWSGEVGHGIRIQQANAVGASLVHRDNVAREGDTGGRVLDDSRAAVEDVWTQQFAEVAVPHLHRRHLERRELRPVVPDPLLAPIEEVLGSAGVEFPGDVERTAEVVAKLVVVNRRRESRGRIRVAHPAIRVERGIAQVLVGAAVKHTRPTPGDNADLGAGGAAVLG